MTEVDFDPEDQGLKVTYDPTDEYATRMTLVATFKFVLHGVAAQYARWVVLIIG